ncbi:MAG: DEAD/DEAH box helicase [Micavibrio sp.]|nr:DEAD/DEAH box helicase [Micavibrio sp.]
MSFEKLGLSEKLIKAIDECGYTQPTPIQEQAIPVVLMAKDVVGLAQTGTGKTASFTLPMIEVLQDGRAKARMPRSLILTPTRELAAQVSENFDTYGKYTKLNMALLVGGVSMEEQVKKLDRGVDVLIATPGRLLDLFERGKILLNDIKILVIDEADRMLDMGFIPDIEKIAGLLPFTRQTLLFSATMQPEIRKLTEKFLSNPKEISVSAPSSTAVNVEQFIVRTSQKSKNDVLAALIAEENVTNAFVFCNRKRDIDGLTTYLKKKGYRARALHGDMVQKARSETFDAFKAGEVDLLICSDVAGRGLDVSDLSHVFNYDVPFNADDYVHRIGRTGRAGKTGKAYMLVTKSDDKYLDAIEILTKQKLKEAGENKASTSNDKAQEDKVIPDKKASTKKTSRRPKAEVKKPVQQDEQHYKKAVQHKDSQDSGDDDSSDSKGFGDEMPAFFSNK